LCWSYLEFNGPDSRRSIAQTLDGMSNRLEGDTAMNKVSLTALAREHLGTARATSSGRSAHTVYGGHEHSLRQTLIALTAGTELDEHEGHGESTLQVLLGRYGSPTSRRTGMARQAITSSSRSPAMVCRHSRIRRCY
jgi:hypothetical protein